MASVGTGTLTALNGTVIAQTDGYGTVVFNVSGTWAATIVIQASIDGVNFFTVQGISPQSTNIFSAFIGNLEVLVACAGYYQVQLIATSFTSGTVNVAYEANLGDNLSLDVPQGVVSTTPPSYGA